MYLKADALMSLFLHIPFPEQLDDETWVMKLAQLKWLGEQGILSVKFNE
ncbi:hypothetical protein [Candidatus Ornithobacterium hominis]|nr:hypothetical protein [Candidatus Ornithobacterium hominis]